jgi:transcriptional regulator with XRE-family HTH domain
LGKFGSFWEALVILFSFGNVVKPVCAKENEIGKRIAEERQRLGLTQEDFASVAGVKRRAQSFYENGHRSPDTAYLARIAEAGADVAYILTGRRTAPTGPAAAQSMGPEGMAQTIHDEAGEYRTVNRKEAAILDLLAGLDEEAVRDIQAVAEKEKQLQELRADVAELQKTVKGG